MENITVANYTLTKRVCKDSKMKDLGEWQNFQVQNDTFLLADVFSNF